MRPLSTIAVLAFALAAAGAALAQPDSGQAPGGGARGAVRAACKADMDKLCPDAQQGPARRQCMSAHQSELSDPCKAAIAQMRAMRQGAGEQPPPSAPPGQ